jgi:Protein of unknown function (DUF3551)
MEREEAAMRRAFLLAGVLVGAWTAGSHQAFAQYLQWCLIANEVGTYNCAYATKAQCETTVSGMGGKCVMNPGYVPAQDQRRTGRKKSAAVARAARS